LNDANTALEEEFKAKSITQKQITSLLTQKIKEQELKTKDIKKQFQKEENINTKQFIK